MIKAIKSIKKITYDEAYNVMNEIMSGAPHKMQPLAALSTKSAGLRLQI